MTQKVERVELIILWMVYYLKSTISSDVAAAVCQGVHDTAMDFKVVFRFNSRGSPAISGIVFYAASESQGFNTTIQDSCCSTNSHESDIFTLTLSVDVDASLPCGIKQNGTTPSIYHLAIGTVGKKQVFTFQCDVNNLQIPTHILQTNFYTEHIQKSGTFIKAKTDETSFEVLYPNDISVPPNTELILGTYIKLRFSYKANPLQSNSNFAGQSTYAAATGILAQSGLLGRSFHVAVPMPYSATVDEAVLRMYTFSHTGTDVHVTGQGFSSVHTFVRWDSPVDVPVPQSHFNGVASKTSWLIESKGLEVIADDADIWMELRVSLAGETISVVNVHPDTVLGKNSRFVVNLVDEMTTYYAVVIGTKDNTHINLTLPSPFPHGDLTIDGTTVGAQTRFTLQLEEGETLAMHCDFLICKAIGFVTSERIAFLISDENNNALQIHAEHNVITEGLYLRDDLKRPTLVAFYVPDFSSGNITGESNEILIDDMYNDKILPVKPSIYQFYPDLFSISDILVKGVTDVSPIVDLGLDQWSTDYLFFFERDTIVTFYVGGTNQSLNGISVIIEDSVQPLSNYLSFVTANGETIGGIPGHPVYEQFIFKVNITTRGNVEFNGTEPFLLYAAVKVSNSQMYAVVPLGYRYKCLDENDVASFCERPTAKGTTKAEIATAYVDRLLLSRDGSFVSPYTVHTDGCNVQNKTYLRNIQPFIRNQDFNDTWVMDTKPFRIFRFAGYDYLNFRLEFKYCFKAVTNCINSCGAGTGLTKRSFEKHAIDVKIKVKGPRRKTCSRSRYYWLPHVILLLIIVIQVVTTVYMLCVKWRLNQGRIRYSP